MSELKCTTTGSKYLICCFAGVTLKMGSVPVFEFLNYLSSVYANQVDLLFYIDKQNSCYHKGIEGITTNIDDTVSYLNTKISNYDKVIFMGTSAGGYASILFGSLCNNVTHVISFIPKTKLSRPLNLKYSDLVDVINTNTNYILFGDMSIKHINDSHHISQCERLEHFTNVKIIKNSIVDLKQLRDNGTIKNTIDEILSL